MFLPTDCLPDIALLNLKMLATLRGPFQPESHQLLIWLLQAGAAVQVVKLVNMAGAAAVRVVYSLDLSASHRAQ